MGWWISLGPSRVSGWHYSSARSARAGSRSLSGRWAMSTWRHLPRPSAVEGTPRRRDWPCQGRWLRSRPLCSPRRAPISEPTTLLGSRLVDRFSGGSIFPFPTLSLGITRPDMDTIDRIEQTLDTLRPYIASHRGQVEVVDFDESEGILLLRLGGTCHGCAASTVTLKQGIESRLREMVPEVKHVEAV